MLVFVYGTLMREQPNHRVLVELDAKHIGPAITSARRTLVDLGPYPALLSANAARDSNATAIAGEIYELDDATLDALDAFEGCPDLYARERIALDHAGATTEAWTYVLADDPPPHAVVVTTGRYAGGGIVLRTGAREVLGKGTADTRDPLDNSAPNEDGSATKPR